MKKKLWNKKTSREEALKYTKRTDFKEKSQGAYRHALRNGFLNEICDHMPKFYPDYTYEECEQENNKYKTKTEFKKNSQPMHDYAYKKGWLREFPAFDSKRSCVQLTKDNQFITRFDSLSEVERKLGLCHSTVSKCCQGKMKTSGGFKWIFEEDYVKK